MLGSGKVAALVGLRYPEGASLPHPSRPAACPSFRFPIRHGMYKKSWKRAYPNLRQSAWSISGPKITHRRQCG